MSSHVFSVDGDKSICCFSDEFEQAGDAGYLVAVFAPCRLVRNCLLVVQKIVLVRRSISRSTFCQEMEFICTWTVNRIYVQLGFWVEIYSLLIPTKEFVHFVLIGRWGKPRSKCLFGVWWHLRIQDVFRLLLTLVCVVSYEKDRVLLLLMICWVVVSCWLDLSVKRKVFWLYCILYLTLCFIRELMAFYPVDVIFWA